MVHRTRTLIPKEPGESGRAGHHACLLFQNMSGGTVSPPKNSFLRLLGKDPEAQRGCVKAEGHTAQSRILDA